MATATMRVIRDSKHTGTVTRQQVDKVIRSLTGRFIHKHSAAKKRSAHADGHTKR